MSIDDAIKKFELKKREMLLLAENHEKRLDDTDRFVLRVIREEVDAIDLAVSALRAQQEADNNEPLTLEELDNMDGQPVWITPSGFWALVYARAGQRTVLVSNDRDAVFADKEIELVGPVYRRPPKGAQT